MGVRAAWQTWRERRDGRPEPAAPAGPAVLAVAAVTFANGGDNVGVYVPVFTTGGTVGYVLVFLALVAVWCALGKYLATRPVVATALAGGGMSRCPWC
nr:cadmium resistance transporter [Actinophytocola xinjiangensis]